MKPVGFVSKHGNSPRHDIKFNNITKWTNCDHKQLVWCNQLMIVLSNLINTFQSADIVRKKLIGYPGTSIHSDSKK